ncbi:ribonuclease HI [Citrobacter sp. NCU1]|uniref:ribonuclease H family protein n=1 Tax=Citrobacter sp. NCU1 TaxID=2026683 RepID=UPI00139182A7|nr:ribonuclease H [Citrobacter sp. NCU1]NDO83177.1 ribonuclease HI [Citrobacter sp. NCU1]
MNQHVPAAPHHTYRIACDGACNTNHIKSPFRKVGWGFTAIRSDGRTAERSGTCEGDGESNNTAELEAVIQALSFLQPGSNVTLLLDSNYVLKGATEWLEGWKRKGWKKADGKPVLNLRRWQILDDLMQTRNVTFEKVKGHAGHVMNERADALAVAALA